jgi:hypothetical protein
MMGKLIGFAKSHQRKGHFFLFSPNFNDMVFIVVVDFTLNSH